jgi:general secretion pathway protein N
VTKWRKIPVLLLPPCGLLLLGAAPALHAATSLTPDIPANDIAGEARESVEIGSAKPLASREKGKPHPGGNPLWSVPFSVLTATQERPIFSVSRRPAPRAVAAPQRAVELDRSPLALIGAVVGDSDAIAVFFDRASQKIVRLPQGDSHAGWVLTSVQGRAVTPKEAERTETLGLKAAEGVPVLPAPTAIGAGATNTSYAPFLPRSTPKNGEHDGL